MSYYVLVMWDNFINKYYNKSYHLGHYLTATSKMERLRYLALNTSNGANGWGTIGAPCHKFNTIVCSTHSTKYTLTLVTYTPNTHGFHT